MYFQCTKIESTFRRHNFNGCRAGECKLDLEDSKGVLSLRLKKEKVYFSDPVDQFVIYTHKVCMA